MPLVGIFVLVLVIAFVIWIGSGFFIAVVALWLPAIGVGGIASLVWRQHALIRENPHNPQYSKFFPGIHSSASNA